MLILKTPSNFDAIRRSETAELYLIFRYNNKKKREIKNLLCYLNNKSNSKY